MFVPRFRHGVPLLVLPLLALLAACGGEAAIPDTPTATATATATARPSPTATRVPPTATATPEPPSPTVQPPTATALPPTPIPPPPTPSPPPATPLPASIPPPSGGSEIAPVKVAQGGTVVVRVAAPDAAGGVAEFDGRRYPLVRASGDGGGDLLWGVIGLPANQSIGAQAVYVRLVDSQGVTVRELSMSFAVVSAGYPVEYITLAPERASLLAPETVQAELALRAAIFDVFTPQRLWSGLFALPVSGPITSPYGGGRSYNGGPVTDYHHGSDFGVPPGTPIVAANAGRVAYAGALAIRGNSVFIDHGLGVFSSYHHMSQLAVAQGQVVNKGDLVGYVGDTGLAEGAHLHWEIAVRGVNVDPLPWTQVDYGQ